MYIGFFRRKLNIKIIEWSIYISNSRDRLVVRTLRCGRSNPGSNPGRGSVNSLFTVEIYFFKNFNFYSPAPFSCWRCILEWSDFIRGNFKMWIFKSLWSYKLHMIITRKILLFLSNFLKFWDLPLAYWPWRLKI
jgi:hypothetical protein